MTASLTSGRSDAARSTPGRHHRRRRINRCGSCQTAERRPMLSRLSAVGRLRLRSRAYPKPLTDPAIVGTPDFNWNYHSDDTARPGHDIPLPVARCSVAVRRSKARQCAPGRPTLPAGPRTALRVGVGTTSCPLSKRSKTPRPGPMQGMDGQALPDPSARARRSVAVMPRVRGRRPEEAEDAESRNTAARTYRPLSGRVDARHCDHHAGPPLSALPLTNTRYTSTVVLMFVHRLGHDCRRRRRTLPTITSSPLSARRAG